MGHLSMSGWDTAGELIAGVTVGLAAVSGYQFGSLFRSGNGAGAKASQR